MAHASVLLAGASAKQRNLQRIGAVTKTRCPYNSRLLKGGALLEDMRILVRHWSEASAGSHAEAMIAENLLGKQTRARGADTCRRVFLPRYVAGDPPNAWRIARELEDRDLPLETLRPVYYWITARNERLLYDYVVHELVSRRRSHDRVLRTEEVSAWIESRIAKCHKTWSEGVVRRLAQAILAALRDFGILEGAVRKRIAPTYLPVESFAYLAYVIYRQGISGYSLVNHPDWALFLLSSRAVEHQFLEADRGDLLRYQAAGEIVRVDFPAGGFGEMADVVARRAH